MYYKLIDILVVIISGIILSKDEKVFTLDKLLIGYSLSSITNNNIINISNKNIRTTVNNYNNVWLIALIDLWFHSLFLNQYDILWEWFDTVNVF